MSDAFLALQAAGGRWGHGPADTSPVGIAVGSFLLALIVLAAIAAWRHGRDRPPPRYRRRRR